VNGDRGKGERGGRCPRTRKPQRAADRRLRGGARPVRSAGYHWKPSCPERI